MTVDWWASSGRRYHLVLARVFPEAPPCPVRLLEEEDGRFQAFYADGSLGELWGLPELCNLHGCVIDTVTSYEAPQD